MITNDDDLSDCHVSNITGRIPTELYMDLQGSAVGDDTLSWIFHSFGYSIVEISTETVGSCVRYALIEDCEIYE